MELKYIYIYIYIFFYVSILANSEVAYISDEFNDVNIVGVYALKSNLLACHK